MIQPPAVASQPSQAAGKSLEEFYTAVGIVLRGWRLIALGILVALTAAGIYIARSKDVFRATARLLIIQQGGRPVQVASGGDPFQSLQGPNESLSTQLILIRSPAIVERALSMSGLPATAAPSVINDLTVKLPDPSARIIELSYKSGSREEAERVVDGVIESYNRFLKDTYQKNTNEVISLLMKARDELNEEVKVLEKQYLDYRQMNPAYSSGENGPGLSSKRLEHSDQLMQQVRDRSFQLSIQLDLARKLAAEGADAGTIQSALSQVSILGGGSTPATVPTANPSEPKSGRSLEGIEEDFAEAQAQRKTSEQLLAHLKRVLDDPQSVSVPDESEIAREFYDDPEVASLSRSLHSYNERISQSERLARNPDGDPTVLELRRRRARIQSEIQRLWGERKPLISDRLANESNADISAAVRRAEAEVVSWKAREAALRELRDERAAEILKQLRRDRMELVRVHGEKHPSVQHLDARIGRMGAPDSRKSSALMAETGNDALVKAIERSLESVEAMRSNVQKSFDKDLEASRKSEITRLKEENLRSNLDRQRSLFLSVLDQLKQAQLVSDFGSVSAQTINPTSVATERANFMLVTLFALASGCGLGTLTAFVLDMFEARVRTVSEVRGLINLPVLGMIPRMSIDKSSIDGPLGLLCHETPRSLMAESYKSTRTNLELLRRNRPAQVLLVSSARPGDGKSTTASNLAITLASAGRKVLLIDGDLRKPSLHTIYGVDREFGLTTLLEGHESDEGFTQKTRVDNLRLLATGPEVSNPAELLASPRLGECLDQLRSAYDVIVVDSSPLLAVTDPSILASAVDGILLVIRLTSTRRYDVERTWELLRTLGIPVIGLVVNGVALGQFGYGYGYGRYDYGYGYGYGNGHGATGVVSSSSTGESETNGRLRQEPQPNGLSTHGHD